MQFLRSWLARLKALFSTSAAIPVYAPVTGTIVALEEVPDTVFAEKIVGDGVAIDPTGSLLVAPISGRLGKIFETKHAFSILSSEGVELFVHIGIDTISLKGDGFRLLAKGHQEVSVGDPIVEIDLALLRAKAKSVLTPVIVSNVDLFPIRRYASGDVERGVSLLFEVGGPSA